MASQDIILDSNYDLLVEDGDFALGRSEEQEIDLILIAAPGNFRQHPTVGVNLALWVRGENINSQLYQEIETQLRDDGFEDVRIDQSGGKLTVDAIRRK